MEEQVTTGRNGGVYIVSAARTPIGKFGGGLADVPATTLGGIAIQAAVERAGVPSDAIDEVLMGQVLQAGVGQAPARQAALKAGLDESTSATTINRVCGSGLKAIMLASAQIRAGDGEIYVAGGMENMNQGPYLLPKARFGYRLGNAELVDSTVSDGLWCSTESCHMGTHAERVAIKAEVSRADQDRFALESHQKAIAAIDAGRFDDEIVPVPVRRGREEAIVETDEGPRRDSSIEALARLKPVFALPDPEPDVAVGMPDGTVTAGNAPGITDGAAATVVASERAVERLGLTPLARIVGYSQAEVAPEVALPGAGQGRPEAARPHRDAHRGVRPDRDQRGVRRAGAGRRSRTRLRLVSRQRQRRRHRVGAPHRRERRAHRGHPAPRASSARGPLRAGHALPGRRRFGGHGPRARLTLA